VEEATEFFDETAKPPSPRTGAPDIGELYAAVGKPRRTGAEVARDAFMSIAEHTHADGEPWQAAYDASIAHHERPKVSAGVILKKLYDAETTADTQDEYWEIIAQAFLTAYAAAREAGDVE
jgi:hypothetical protein